MIVFFRKNKTRVFARKPISISTLMEMGKDEKHWTDIKMITG